MRTKTLEQNSAQDFAGLQVDLLQKLRNGNITYEQIDWFKNLSFEQREKLMGKSVRFEHPTMKLMDSNIIISRLVGGFGPQFHFNENKTVKYWKSDNFQKYVLNPTKDISNIPEMSFSKHQFTEIMYDKEIIKHFQISKSKGLMTKEEVLWVIASLTSKQPKGEAGILLNNGRYATIIGYMLCCDRVVRAVGVRWDFDYKRWNCTCFDLGRWGAYYEMLSLN